MLIKQLFISQYLSPLDVINNLIAMSIYWFIRVYYLAILNILYIECNLIANLLKHFFNMKVL